MTFSDMEVQVGISGNHCKTFGEANLACITDVSMNADLPHFWFDIMSVGNGVVTLKDRGEVVTLPIKSRHKTEYVEFPMVSSWERLFKDGKPSVYRFVPFKGHRF